MPSPANLLTDFILRQSYADLPEPIRHQAKRCLLDSMGALSAGAVTPLARLTAPVFGEQECARMREAIWHAEDLDNALDIWPRTLARHIEE